MTDAELQRLAELIDAGRGFSLGNGAFTALISTFVAGAISLIGIWLNNRSQSLSKAEEHKRKRREWFLEKQARDVEVIVNALESFMKHEEEFLRKVAINTYRLRHVAEYGAKNFQKHKEHVLSKLNDDDDEEGEAEAVLFWNIFDYNGTIDTWLTYDALRLTAWLENPLDLRKRLTVIGGQMKEINELLVSAMGSVGAEPYSLDTEAQLLRLSQDLAKEMEACELRWNQLTESSAVFQYELIESLREG